MSLKIKGLLFLALAFLTQGAFANECKQHFSQMSEHGYDVEIKSIAKMLQAPIKITLPNSISTERREILINDITSTAGDSRPYQDAQTAYLAESSKEYTTFRFQRMGTNIPSTRNDFLTTDILLQIRKEEKGHRVKLIFIFDDYDMFAAFRGSRAEAFLTILVDVVNQHSKQPPPAKLYSYMRNGTQIHIEMVEVRDFEFINRVVRETLTLLAKDVP